MRRYAALVVSVPIPLRTQQTGVPTRRKAFLRNYGKQKSANEHLPQTYAIFLTILPQNDKIQLYLCFEEKNYILTSGGGYLR